MKTKIQKWGNSLEFRLPKSLAQEVNLAEGRQVEIIADDATLRITPIAENRITLKKLLAEYSKVANAEKELDWGKPEPDEKW